MITALHSRKEHRLGGGSHTTHEALSLIILIVQVPSYFTDSFIKKQKKPFIPPQIWDERIFYMAPSNQEKRKPFHQENCYPPKPNFTRCNFS